VKNSTKAVFLSALIFPGTGHLFLKKSLSGGILVGTSLVAISYIIAKATEKALNILEQIQNGDFPLDITAIAELVSKQSTGADSQLFSIATTIFIICWIIGIVDAYRIACIQKNNNVN
jgi:hypothetical protein